MSYRHREQTELFPGGDKRSMEWAVWCGMPEYAQEDKTAWKRLVVNFRNHEDFVRFCEQLGIKYSERTSSVWYPASPRIEFEGVRRYASDGTRMPTSPIYVVSRGRSDRCITSRELTRRGLPHFVVVEADEADLYRSSLAQVATVLVLDPAFQRAYEPCDDLADSKSLGPGPARNFAWEHALALGAAWHWVMDDNIDGFYRLNRNLKVPADGSVLAAMEAFADRYENVSMAGPAYHGFTHQREQRPPVFLNTRIYSCNLIRNDLPYRWRGRYNEDTDLSLRMLKDGWVTVQFNAFLQRKRATQQMKGGNTEAFYTKEGTLPKSEMLAQLHPDVARVIQRWGRWHHFVDYRGFTQQPRLRPGVVVPSSDEFGMTYQVNEDGEWVVPDNDWEQAV